MKKRKNLFVLLFMLLLFLNTKVLGNEENLEAKLVNLENKATIQKFTKADYIYPKKISLGASTYLPQKYDLRNYMNIKVRNQGETMLCWMYSTNTAIETNYKKYYNGDMPEIDILQTDKEMMKLYNKASSAGNKENYEGGSQLTLLNYYTSGKGPLSVTSKNVDIEIDDFVIFPSIYKKYENDKIKYYNYNSITGKEEEYSINDVVNIRNQIKQHIMKYGAITTSVFSTGNEYYNKSEKTTDFNALYCDNVGYTTDHSVTIIGWDDNYSKENFNKSHRPINDGAYIVLNSWGEEFSEKGVFYVSYDDCFIENVMYGIEKVSSVNYKNIYQHDELGINSLVGINEFTETYGANVFERKMKDNEYLTQISISNLINSSYEIYINPNDGILKKENLIKVAQIENLSAGYHTIKFENPIKLNGTKFAVVVKYINNFDNETGIFGVEKKIPYDKNWENVENSDGESFISQNMRVWKDINDVVGLEGANLTIKAFTEEKTTQELIVQIAENRIKSKNGINYIMSIEPNTKLSEIKKIIYTNGTINSNILDNTNISTGDKITINLNDKKQEYILIVAGDINGDGKSDFIDMSVMNKIRLGMKRTSDIELLAGDVYPDEKIDIWDMARINKYRLGKISKIVMQNK